ncbi:MAG: CDP-diacylglycerol--glycerol-3-phosphate 3-phosphatidyltransferase, partial [Neisseriaceae bacterium]|nr:CDP-diacylglycerol--glycerol-3-phosphate 3-phosphatidyltransferase [Neisseriaceae bacterium]
ELMARKNRSDVVAVAKIGKWKTAAQMTAIIMLLLGSFPYFGWDLHDLGNVFLFIAVILTIISFVYYVKEIYLDLSKKS